MHQNSTPNLLPVPTGPEAAGEGDSLALWAEHYLRFEVTTSARSQKEQRRDLALFLRFMEAATGTLERSAWTPRLSRAVVEVLRKEINTDGSRHYSDRTINRVAAHLKTFAKWVHKLRPFPLGNPTEKLKGLALNGVLELERALTPDERRRLLDAADHLPVLGGRSRDRRRCRHFEFPDERPRRKGYRPWRNRAIVYTLIETGMRRAEVTSIDLNGINVDHHTLLITEKGGRQRRCQISKEGLKAIRDYVREERGNDAELFPESPALFLPADTVTRSAGRLTPAIVNRLWNDLCLSARVKGRTPHSARHAMGVHLVTKTHNPRTAQRQLGHKNPSTTMQYMQFTKEQMQEALDDRE